MENLRNLYKKLISLFSGKDKQFLNKYEVGDVVWAEMPLCKEELEEIEPSHRIRPYLIVDVDSKKGLYKALKSTTQRKGNYNSSMVVHEGTHKISCIIPDEIWELPENNIFNYMYKIHKKDAIDITKRMLFQCSASEDLEFVKNYIDEVLVSAGDIVQIKDDKFYVYAMDNDKYYLFKTYDEKPELVEDINEYVNRKGLHIKISEFVFLNIEVPCIVIDMLRPKDITDVIHKRNQYEKDSGLKNNNDKNNELVKNVYQLDLEFGDIVKYGNRKYIYIYTNESEGLNYLVNIARLEKHPSDFCQRKPVSHQFKKIGSLSNDELLTLLRQIRPLLVFICSSKVSNEIKNICDKAENSIVRQRV